MKKHAKITAVVTAIRANVPTIFRPRKKTSLAIQKLFFATFFAILLTLIVSIGYLIGEKSYCILPHFELLFNIDIINSEVIWLSNEFGNDFINISDDDGNDYVLEHLDTIEVNGVFYMAFLPTDLDENDDNYGMVILKVIEEGGEDVLISIDDDDDLVESLHERFLERLLDDEEE